MFLRGRRLPNRQRAKLVLSKKTEPHFHFKSRAAHDKALKILQPKEGASYLDQRWFALWRDALARQGADILVRGQKIPMTLVQIVKHRVATFIRFPKQHRSLTPAQRARLLAEQQLANDKRSRREV